MPYICNGYNKKNKQITLNTPAQEDKVGKEIMNTDGLVFFEDVRGIEDEPRYYAYRRPKFMVGYLHEAWGMDEYSAGDYSVSATTLCDNLEKELREHFSIDDNADIELESVSSTPGCEEIVVNIDGEEDKSMSVFATDYARKNSHYVEAKWFDYFDGSNWKSVIIECEVENAVDMYLVTDEDTLNELVGVVAKFNNYCEGTSKTEEIDGYEVGCSLWANDPWACYLT